MPLGFEFAYDLEGNAPIIETVVVKASAVITKGEMLNLESGEADAGATSDTAFLGASCEDCDNTADGLSVQVIVNAYAVYRVTDANAREKGALLDLGSGGLTLATDSNHDLIVVEKSTASEPTLVTFNRTHYLT